MEPMACKMSWRLWNLNEDDVRYEVYNYRDGEMANENTFKDRAYDGEAQKRVFVENNWDPVTVADAAWSAKIRLRGGLKSPIVTEIKRGGTVTVLEQYDNWARVMTPDGHIGYMHKWKMKKEDFSGCDGRKSETKSKSDRAVSL